VIHGERLTRLGQPDGEPRAWLGVQLGGSGYVQLVLNYRVAGPLSLEGGGFLFGPPPMLNGSLGFVLDAPLSPAFRPYVGSGGGFGFLIAEGRNVPDDCDPDLEDCPGFAGDTASTFLYARLGLAVLLGRELRDAIRLEGGAWYGILHDDIGDDSLTSSRTFLWPMAGFSYLRAF
jgi:hypothetical protein